MTIPIDATTTPAWARLTELNDALDVDFRQWFKDDSRAEKFTFRAGDLYVDLSKTFLTDEVQDALLELAEQVNLTERREAMLSGERINVTENRAVLHTALRRDKGEVVRVDGDDVVGGVHEVLDRMYAFADKVRDGEWTGITGKPIRTVVNVGIGGSDLGPVMAYDCLLYTSDAADEGSDLGPVMAYEALKPYVKEGLECRFVSNIDPTDAGETLKGLDPETTLVIVASKTFTTLETLTNARQARNWLLKTLEAQGAPTEGAVAKHFVAVSTALDKVDSAVGLSLAIALGKDGFEDFLAGFRTMDRHFAQAPAEENVPLLMGLLNVFYVNFAGAATHAVLPYSQYLHRFPAYLQQLTMESNGKRVRWDGTPVTSATGEVFWGEPGTNGQHAFYQLIHQGTQLIPADFIAFANPTFAFKDGDSDQHELFLGNFFGQTNALAFGKTADEVRAEGVAEELVSAKVFPGNKPTASIMAPALTPSVLGQLIALYEHITFVQGIVWGIDSFDQWGVELGKAMAKALTSAVEGDREAIAAQDSSTRGLIEYYRANRK